MDETIATIGEGALFRTITEFIVVSGAVVTDFAGVEDEVAAVGEFGAGTERWRAWDVAGCTQKERE